MPKHQQPVEGRPLALGQLPKRQVACLGPTRHPLRNYIRGWRQHDQGQFSAIEGHRRCRRLVVLKASARVAKTTSGSLAHNCCQRRSS
jgi:hypothetical protein